MNAPLKNTLRSLGDADSLAHGVTTTALTSGLALIDPRTLKPWQRFFYRTKIAGLTGWMIWAAMRQGGDTVPPATRAGVTAAAVGATLAAAELGEAMDARMHDGLVRRGVKRPRVVLALATLALGGVSWALGRGSEGFGSDWRAATDSFDYDTDDDAHEVLFTEVPDEVRALTEAILKSTRKFASLDLRAQLKDARGYHYESELGEQLTAFEFDVPDGVALAVPGNGNFPVVGRFRALGDRTFEVYLTLQEGKLTHISVTEGSDWNEDEIEAWMESGQSVYDLKRWPTPDELELLIETREGLSSIASS